jgi:subtilisin-like proprotein convertase family protein
MHSPRSILKTLVVIAILVLAGVFLLRGFKHADPAPAITDQDRPQGVAAAPVETAPTPDAPAPALPPPAPQPAAAPVVSDRTWQLAGDEGGAFVLALDEAITKDADGKETLLKLSPPATEATLKARLDEIQAWPVVYLAGEERSEATRRRLTPDLRVRLDGADPALVARAATVEIKDLPDYAPGWAVLAAADPFAALEAMDRLRANGLATADVLLAAQRQKRAMPVDTLIGQQWHLKNTNTTRTHINVETIWNYPNTGIRGKNIRIGIIDDGMQHTHPDLSPNADTTNDWDWNGGDGDPTPGAGDDHGTACAGNAGARGNNNLGVSGSAPEATLVGMRLIAGGVTDAQEAEAMNWKNDIIQVKSNSWGPSDTGTILDAPGTLTRAALQTATTSGRGGKGTIFLWAGGNGGGNNDNSNYDGYANSIYTIGVGASDSNGNRSSYSEPGANILVVGPSSGAIGITTTDLTGAAGYSSNDYTNSFGGTSSSTPTVAGVVALMLEKNPNLGWRDVQEILVRSAFKIKPTDSGWANNGAGIPFNHNFGAGLVDATAAVNLATGWTNLAAMQTTSLADTGLPLAIPDNNTTGISRTFDFSTTNLRVEQVTVRMSATHTYRGDLVVTLISPSGMSSLLAAKRSDSNDNYSNWTFSSVRHWGESSRGTWTVKVQDAASGNTGTLTACTVSFFGTEGPPINPPPLAQITSPQNGAIYSPGATVNVAATASDLSEGGAPGTVTKVDLLLNGNVAATDATAPYAFAITPPNGDHTLVARATDAEGATGNSASISISVFNQPPVVTAASLNAGATRFADEGLAVASITATDPENDTLSYQYQWQSSTDADAFTDAPGANSATLAPSPDLAGKLWRCVVTAADATNTSVPFTTATSNVLARPPTTAVVGQPFSHSSGLVLRAGGSILTRQAIIHEFSQGPVDTTSEWIEILTLRNGNLGGWHLRDSSGTRINFRNTSVWNNIPAGTLIVIYNGNTTKDPLLPPDDTTPADGRMILSTSNSTYFESSSWPELGNSGDAILLSNPGDTVVHQLAFGNSSAATPNIGAVGSGKSAYFRGDTEEAASLASGWRITTSTAARSFSDRSEPTPKVTTKALGDLFISEYVEGTGTNSRALELYNPAFTAIDLNTQGYKIEIYTNGSTSATSIPLTGTVPAGGTFVIKHTSAYLALVAQQTSSDLVFNGDDAIVLKKGSTIVDSFGRVGQDPGTGWSNGTIQSWDRTLQRKSSIVKGDVIADDAFNIQLEWNVFPESTGGFGTHSITIPPAALTVSVAPSTFLETAGPNAAVGTVSLSYFSVNDITVTLNSSDTASVTVPTTVVIPAGQPSATFAVGAVDDTESDGPQIVEISATATGYASATTNVTVTDNEPNVEGVTPGAGNNTVNTAFINLIRSGGFGAPPEFRFGVGSVVPVGLTINPVTGLVSGTINVSNPLGNYPIHIQSFNQDGEVITQSFILTLTDGSVPNFAAWIATHPAVGSLNGRLDDPDGDGLSNAVENLLGSLPTAANPGLQQVSTTGASLVFHHTFAEEPASDVTGSYEWSPDLVNWHASGALAGGVIMTITSETVTDPAHPEGWKRVTATATQGQPGQCFVRLRAN